LRTARSCTFFHARAAIRQSAFRQEAAEAIGVILLIHSGPATIHAPRANDFCEFLATRRTPAEKH
jgi:alkylhydroperoxidase/carboxymuconolactone decarboxylase family protein YurZ